MSEEDRLAFVEQRDGHVAALTFAEQTLAVYVADSIKRGPHKDSIEACIKYLEQPAMWRDGYLRKVLLVSIAKEMP